MARPPTQESEEDVTFRPNDSLERLPFIPLDDRRSARREVQEDARLAAKAQEEQKSSTGSLKRKRQASTSDSTSQRKSGVGVSDDVRASPQDKVARAGSTGLDPSPCVDMSLVSGNAKEHSEEAKSKKSEFHQQRNPSVESNHTSAASRSPDIQDGSSTKHSQVGHSQDACHLTSRQPTLYPPGKSSKQNHVAPTSISVSAIGSISLRNDCDVHSLHGLLYDALPAFTWTVEEGASFGEPSCPAIPVINSITTNSSVMNLNGETTATSEALVAPPLSKSLRTDLDVAGSASSPIPQLGRVEVGSETRGDIILTDYLSHNRLWDTYMAIYDNIDLNTRHNIIAKLACTDTNDGLSSFQEDFGSPLAAEAAIRNEAGLYSGPLSSLQRDVVPGFLGLFSGSYRCSSGEEKTYFLMLMEDAGVHIWSFDTLKDSEKKRVEDMYEKLHARKVAHCDVQVRHVLQDEMRNLKLIDFEGAMGGADSAILSDEMEEVKELLYGCDHDAKS